MSPKETNSERIERLEDAIIQFNHFTEHVEKLDLAAWKADISADVRWLKYLVGVGAAAGVFTAVGEAIKLLK